GPADLYYQWARNATHAGALSIVDAHGPPLLEALKANPSLAKPNCAELASTLGRQLPDDAALISAMRELWERGTQRIVVTSGKAPALAFDGQTFWKISSPTIKAINPIGSGDAFTGGWFGGCFAATTSGNPAAGPLPPAPPTPSP